MTAQLSFDTLAFAKRLAAAGMDSRQAQALAEALNDIVFDTLSTKNDLRDLGVATSAQIDRLEAMMREMEHRLTNSLTVRTGAMIAGSTALIVAILGTLNSLQ
jgi:two-component sensor histidine kinase